MSTGEIDRYSSRVLAEFMARRKIEKAMAKRSGPGFSAAMMSRLTAGMPTSTLAVNAELDNALGPLRARARSLAVNYEHGRRFLSLVAANIIGADGPTLQVRAMRDTGGLDVTANDAVEMAFNQFQKQVDVRGLMDMAHLQRVGVMAVARDGDVLIRKRVTRDAFQVQLLEADRLDENINGVTKEGNQVRLGVEVDTMGRPVAYHVRTRHPNDNWRNNGGDFVERIPASEIYHPWLPVRPEQVRGYSWMHAVIIKSGLLNKFSEAAVTAATIGASKMGVFTRKEGADGAALAQLGDGEQDNALQMSAEAGEFFELPAGYSLETWDPQYPNEQFGGFVKACMRSMATGLDVAAHNLSGDMTDVNFSSARIAELSERDSWMTLQQWWINSVTMPIYRDWLAWALARGDITFPSGSALPASRYEKFLRASKFFGRRWGWVDPLKDIQASREAIAEGLASRTEIAANKGREWTEIVAELAEEEAVLKAAGIPRATITPAVPDAAPEGASA
jgi:lambda family phage portal protein